MRPGHSYRFTIVNFYKAGSLYNKGMRPLMYSERQAAKGVGWRRVGSNIKYFKTNIRWAGRGGVWQGAGGCGSWRVRVGVAGRGWDG